MLSKSTKIILNYIFGLLLFVWLCYSIYRQLRHQENLNLSFRQMRQGLEHNWFQISLVVILMFINWGIEARKWQILVRPLERIPFRKSFYAILSGVSFSVVTPNRIGEYGGRILYLRNKNRLAAISVTGVGNLSQLIVTLILGMVGLLYYLSNFGLVLQNEYSIPHYWENIFLFVVLFLTAFVFILYFRLRFVVGLFSRIRWLKRIRAYVLVINKFSNYSLAAVLALSLSRYLVFSAQYLILLNALGAGIIWWQGFLMIFLIYLVMAVIPTIAIAELGIRGELGLFFLGLLSMNKVTILAATAGIWLINLLIPAILGSLLLPGIKVLNEERTITAAQK